MLIKVKNNSLNIIQVCENKGFSTGSPWQTAVGLGGKKNNE